MANCIHRWVVQQPNGTELIAGYCRLCGATRTWPSNPDEYSVTSRPQHKTMRSIPTSKQRLNLKR